MGRWRGKYHALIVPLALACALPAAGQQRLVEHYMQLCDSAAKAGNSKLAIQTAGVALGLADGSGDSLAGAAIRVRRSTLFLVQGDYTSGLNDLQGALPIYEKAGDHAGMATVYNTIGSIHYFDRNFQQANEYYRKSLAMQIELGNRSEQAMLYGNVGSALQEMGQLDSALAYHKRSLAIRLADDQQDWWPICYANLGSCFSKMGRTDSALHYLEVAQGLYAPESRNSIAYCQLLIDHGMALIPAGRYRQAIRYCEEGYAMAMTLTHTSGRVKCYECLYKAWLGLGDKAKALEMHERYIALRDSVSSENRNKDLLRLELTYNFERARLADSLKRAEADHQAQLAYQYGLAGERDQKRLYLLGGVALLMVAGGLWGRLRYMARSRRMVQMERDRSDKLLLNILPRDIANELKMEGRVEVREVGQVSILFTDFNEFTKLAERMSAQDLVSEIDACYRSFDEIVARYGLEKIKTIGDAYMCAGGLPQPRPNSARHTVLAALEMQAWLQERYADRRAQGLPAFRMRAGIHTGSVVAGIVGESKFQYDIWGDTVNTASRMESAGAVNEVNVSQATVELLKDDPVLQFRPRGRIEVKGKGQMLMFFAFTRSEVKMAVGAG